MAEILVVDDDPDIRTLIRLTLESYGYSVREAGDGLQALEALTGTVGPTATIPPTIDAFTDAFEIEEE